MEELELNKPYKLEEITLGLFGIKASTFNAHKEKWKKELDDCYEWKMEKRKYILTKKLKDYHKVTKHEKQYKEVYLPAVLNYMKNEAWTTITGVSIFILNDEQVHRLQHALETAKTYVREVIINEYDIIDKKYAACYGTGNYARLMTDEECGAWREMKRKYSAESNNRIMDLTEQYMHKLITMNEYTKELRGIASGAYATALIKWMEEYGFIPVMINHYEKKGIEFKEEEDYYGVE